MKRNQSLSENKNVNSFSVTQGQRKNNVFLSEIRQREFYCSFKEI